jgi:IS5 family transposase
MASLAMKNSTLLLPGFHLQTLRRKPRSASQKLLDEGVFARRPKQVRYRRVAKNQFAAFLQAMAFHLKRLLVLEAKPLWA